MPWICLSARPVGSIPELCSPVIGSREHKCAACRPDCWTHHCIMPWQGLNTLTSGCSPKLCSPIHGSCENRCAIWRPSCWKHKVIMPWEGLNALPVGSTPKLCSPIIGSLKKWMPFPKMFLFLCYKRFTKTGTPETKPVTNKFQNWLSMACRPSLCPTPLLKTSWTKLPQWSFFCIAKRDQSSALTYSPFS